MQKLTRTDIASHLVARRGGVSEQTVRRWEKGKTAIPDNRQLALSELFGISVPYLMGPVNG